MTFGKRNIASYLTASLFDTAVEIICAWAQAHATSEKGDSQHVAKWPIIEYQSLVLTSFFQLSIIQILVIFVETKVQSSNRWKSSALIILKISRRKSSVDESKPSPYRLPSKQLNNLSLSPATNPYSVLFAIKQDICWLMIYTWPRKMCFSLRPLGHIQPASPYKGRKGC